MLVQDSPWLPTWSCNRRSQIKFKITTSFKPLSKKIRLIGLITAYWQITPSLYDKTMPRAIHPIISLLIIAAAFPAEATFLDSLRFRARESYETLDIKSGNLSDRYAGFTNTINLFYEKPFKHSYGLAFGSLFSGLNSSTSTLALDTSIEFYFLGLEAKVFLSAFKTQGLFIRPGAYLQQLHNDGVDSKINSTSASAGIGYEFLITDRKSVV